MNEKTTTSAMVTAMPRGGATRASWRHGVVLAAVLGAGMFATPATAEAGCEDLGRAAEVITKVLDGSCKVAGDKFDCTKLKAGTAELRKLIDKWNEAFKDSSLTIGPRSIGFNAKESGMLVLGGKRTFISTTAATMDKALVTITKRDGKASTITVCTVDARGARTSVGTIRFDAKDKNGSEKRLALTGVSGKVVVVQLDADKTQKFAYDVHLK